MSLQTIILNTVFSLLLATNVVGNTLVIFVILKNQTMKTAMNYLLLNLAVADVMVGVFFAPGFLLMPMFAHPTGTAGDILCEIVTGNNFAWVAFLASAFTLVLVSIERYCAIVYPLNVSRKITKRKLRYILPLLWLLAITLTLPSFVGDRFVERDHSCYEKLPHRWQNVAYATVWVLCAGIPAGIMLLLYSIVIYSFWFGKSITGNSACLAERNSRKRITKMVITISAIFVLCCLPNHILYCVHVFYPDVFSGSKLFFPISHILVVLNSTVNPFVYAFQFAEFRKYLRKLICCKEAEISNFLDETSRNVRRPPRSGPSVDEVESRV